MIETLVFVAFILAILFVALMAPKPSGKDPKPSDHGPSDHGPSGKGPDPSGQEKKDPDSRGE
jgi:hypothetical protein